MYGSKRVAVRELNPHILCALCGGYLIQATTVIECLHSFCRSCIVNFLETSKVCPICDAQIHKTRPLLNIRPDQTLQSLVYKLVPGLFQDEMRRRREFHATLTESDLEDLTLEEKGEASLEREFKPGDDHISLILQMAFRKNDKKEFKVKDTRYLLCPSEVTIKHLKRFVKCKFQLGENFKVEMFRGGEELTDDLMLQDIALIYSWRGDKPMHICYTVQQRDWALTPKVKIKLEQPAETTCRGIPKSKPTAVDPMREPVMPLTVKPSSRTTACSTAPSTTSSYSSAPSATATPSTTTRHTPGVLTTSAPHLQTAQCSPAFKAMISDTTKKCMVFPSKTPIISPKTLSVTGSKTPSVPCTTASSSSSSSVKPTPVTTFICNTGTAPGLPQPVVKKERRSPATSKDLEATTPSNCPPSPTLAASWDSETEASSVSHLLHSVQSILNKGTKKPIPVASTLSWTPVPVSEPQEKQPGDAKCGRDKIDLKVTADLETRTFQPDSRDSLKTGASSQVLIKMEADDSSTSEKLTSSKLEKCSSLKTESPNNHECDSSKNGSQESSKNESSESVSSKHRRKHKSAKRDKKDKRDRTKKRESRKSSSKRNKSSKHETDASEMSTLSDNKSSSRDKRETSKSKKRKSSKRSKRESQNDDSLHAPESESQRDKPCFFDAEKFAVNRTSEAPSSGDCKPKCDVIIQRPLSVIEKPTWSIAVGGLPTAATATLETHHASGSNIPEDSAEDFFDYIPKFQKHRKIMPLKRSISCEGEVKNPAPTSVSNSDAMEKRNWKKRKLSTMDLSSSSVTLVGSSNLCEDYTLGSVSFRDKTSEASSPNKSQTVNHMVCGVSSVPSSDGTLHCFSEKVPLQSGSIVFKGSVPDRPPASSSFSCLPFVPPQNGTFPSSFTKQQGKEESAPVIKTSSSRDQSTKINSTNNNEVSCSSKNGAGDYDSSVAVSGRNRTSSSRSTKSTSRGNPSVAPMTAGVKLGKHAPRPKIADEKLSSSAGVMRTANIHKSLEEICVEISSSPSDVSSVTSPATDVTSPGTEDRADTSTLPEIQSPCDTGCVVHFHGRVGPLDLSSKKKK